MASDPQAAKPLAARLAEFGAEHEWPTSMSTIWGTYGTMLCFKVGPAGGYGHTTNEAVNACADHLVNYGWRDDRGPNA